MVNLSDILTIMLYMFLIILIIILIILGIKLIRTLKKVDNVIEDVNDKMSKVNGVFNMIDRTTDFAAEISDKVIGTLSKFINVLTRKKKGKDKNEEEK